MKNDDKVKKITLGLVLGWVFGLLLFMAGFGAITGNEYLQGLVYVMAGLVIFPPAIGWVKSKWSFELSGVLSAIICIVLIVFASRVGLSKYKSTINSNYSTNQVNIFSGEQAAQKATPLPTAPVGKVEVKSMRLTNEGYGFRYVVGEVVNNSDKPATFVKVTATYYDKAGEVSGTSFTYAGDTSSTPLTPNATTPFKVSVEKNIEVDRFKLDVTWDKLATKCKNSHLTRPGGV